MEQKPNFDEIKDIKQYMIFEGIDCKKYNYSLDSDVQMLSCQGAKVYLHKSGDRLIIINKNE